MKIEIGDIIIYETPNVYDISFCIGEKLKNMNIEIGDIIVLTALDPYCDVYNIDQMILYLTSIDIKNDIYHFIEVFSRTDKDGNIIYKTLKSHYISEFLFSNRRRYKIFKAKK